MFRLGKPAAPRAPSPNRPKATIDGWLGGGAGWCELNEKMR
jgi:hypothetical protein